MDDTRTTGQSSRNLLLVEELMLILLNENFGYLETTDYWNLECAIAGTIIGELSLLGRIDVDLKSLYVIDRVLTGDEILDPFLTEIAEGTQDETAHTPRFWIEKFAVKVDPCRDIIFDRLVQKNYLTKSDGGFYTAVKEEATQNIGELPVNYPEESRNRVKEVIKSHECPTLRDTLLVALLDASDSMQFLFESDEHSRFQDRIANLVDRELVAQSLRAAVSKAYVTLTSHRTQYSERTIPRMPLRELLRKSMQEKNLPLFFNEIYEEYGPVVEIWFPKIRQRTVLLFGAETNNWLNRNGRFFFRSKEYIRDFESAFGTTQSLTSMDGCDHFRLRELLKPGYSKNTLETELPNVIAIAKRSLCAWKIGEHYPITSTITPLLSAQVSQVMLGTENTTWHQDLLDYETRCIITEIQRSLPHFMHRTSAMRRKLRKSVDMVNMIQNNHKIAPRQGKPKSLIDHVLEIHRTDKNLLPATDLFFTIASPIMASANMGALLSFVIWHMLKNPNLLARVRGEAEKLFADGREPNATDFQEPHISNTLHLVLECLRLYPTISGQIRHVTKECRVAGFNLPVGLRTFWAISAPHYSDAHFKNPNEFDIDRFGPPREEHVVPGVFNPWGIGTHVCIGKYWAQLQLTVNTLLIAHYLDLDLPKSSQKMKTVPFPKNALHKKIAFKVTGHRDRF